jgi:(E)-4-hydroxy-3-methylbut-2-enyl-diphosphate synthase
MKRKRTRQVKLGSVKIGGGAPVSIQSMANTDTKDISSTVKQIILLEKAGCEIIRVAVKDRESAAAIKGIKKRISIPLEADIHFDYRLAILAAKSGADGIRLNPGNIYKTEQVKKIIEVCRGKKIPIRIGANSGSLRAYGGKCYSISDALVKSVIDYIKIFEKQGFNNIMISLKASDVMTTLEAYRKVSLLCDYPLHIGVTATGQGDEAVIKSSIGIGALLSEGIGDTIRVSLTSDPKEEVIIGRRILQALGLRHFFHDIISCPTCGRCQVNLIKIVKEVKRKLSTVNCQLSQPKAGPPPAGTKKSLAIAVMGCEVNGPGEAKDADIGIAFGRDSGILFKKGKVIKKVSAKSAVKELVKLINN